MSKTTVKTNVSRTCEGTIQRGSVQLDIESVRPGEATITVAANGSRDYHQTICGVHLAEAEDLLAALAEGVVLMRQLGAVQVPVFVLAGAEEA